MLSSDLSVTKVSGLPIKASFWNSLTSLIKFVSATDFSFYNSFSLPLSLSSKKKSFSLSVFAKCVLPGELVPMILILRLLIVMSSAPPINPIKMT